MFISRIIRQTLEAVCVCVSERMSVSANREKTRANIHLFIKRAEREDVL